ncbi:DUF1553 domain-containing protein [Litoribaculum gwangyangense]|uniref:DUF1553 domain-containing protein n=1 Tax=Litoribaculum gwangyangense TaxID=1130722 RepID=A0ABP9C6E9_9FLAO
MKINFLTKSFSYSGIINYSFILGILLNACSNPLTKEVTMAYDSLPEYVDYNFHIKPILSDRCYTCHGPDPQTRKAGLRLDIEEEAFKKLESGNYAFVRNRISKSEVIHRLVSNDLDKIMPPPEAELNMSPREIALIAKWIEQGAQWKEHWSFLALNAPEVPQLNNEWKRNNSIDNYIQDNLVQLGLEPSTETDKEHLIRRITMDLTGLPPSVEDIDAFLNDTSEDAYEKVVDRLLQSDAYAERMAQEWMDVSRYSDSHGVSFDGYRTSWPFRDWVIQAFKNNMPYDKFITHQLAGDLIPDANEQSKIATAFVRMNPLEGSAGSIPEEFRVEYVNERAGVTGTALLGLTVECAKCHDHKFDPISQKEFYQISAFFNNTMEYGLAPADSDRPPTIILLNDKEKSEIKTYIESLNTEKNELDSEVRLNYTNYQKPLPKAAVSEPLGYYAFNTIKPYKKEIKRKKKKEEKKEEKKDKNKIKEKKKEAVKKKVFKELQMLDDNKEAEANLKITLTDGKYGKAAYFNEEYDNISLLKIGEFEHYDSFSISTWINTEKDSIGSSQTIIGNSGTVLQFHRGWELALDSTNHVRVRFIHRLPDEVISVSSLNSITANQWNQVGFTYDGSQSATGISIFINGKKVNTRTNFDQLKRSILPVNFSVQRDSLPLVVGSSNRKWTEDLGLFRGAIDEIRIYNEQLSQWEMAILGEAEIDENSKGIKEEYWFLKDKALASTRTKMRKKRIEISKILDSANELMVMEDLKVPRKTYILEKGLYNQHGEAVEPGGIDKVLPYSSNLPKNRLGLTKWLFDDKNPIVPRVAINRYWQMIFGQGLVKTAEDFGSQGERPSHPELLDWLAVDFKNNGWDIKRSIKQMVMSYTYRQTSFCEEYLRELDPENKYLARSPSYRWPAEMIRDNALKASGLLVEEIGGPSVKPYQPDGLWAEVGMGSKKLSKYVSDKGKNLYRRSLYTFSRRFAPNPTMINFDMTSKEICTIRRTTTSTPLQALTLLNDPQFVEASRVLSEKVQKEFPNSLNQQIELAFRRSTGLKPNKEQLEILTGQYQQSLEQFKKEPVMADSILSVGEWPFDKVLSKESTAAMTLVVSTILNFDESYMKR